MVASIWSSELIVEVCLSYIQSLRSKGNGAAWFAMVSADANEFLNILR
jgi:hypothetical protein